MEICQLLDILKESKCHGILYWLYMHENTVNFDQIQNFFYDGISRGSCSCNACNA